MLVHLAKFIPDNFSSLEARQLIVMTLFVISIPQIANVSRDYFTISGFLMIYSLGLSLSLVVMLILKLKNRKQAFLKEDLDRKERWFFLGFVSSLPGAILISFLPMLNHEPSEIHLPEFTTTEFHEVVVLGFSILKLTGKDGVERSFVGLSPLEINEECLAYDAGEGNLSVYHLSYISGCKSAEFSWRSRRYN